MEHRSYPHVLCLCCSRLMILPLHPYSPLITLLLLHDELVKNLPVPAS